MGKLSQRTPAGMKRLVRAIAAAMALACSIAASTRQYSHVGGRGLRRNTAMSACTCDCCEVEFGHAEPGISEGSAQCALVEADRSGTQAIHCGNLCLQSEDDQILTETETPELDAQRFCLHECRPHQQQLAPAGDSAEQETAQPIARGDPCSVVSPHDAPSLAASMLHGSVFRRSAAPSTAPAPPPPAAAPAAPNPQAEQSARVVEWGKEAARNENDAQGVMTQIDKLVDSANNAVPKALEAAERAKQAARKATAEEADVKRLLDNVRRVAGSVAEGLVPDLVKKMEKTARETAKTEAEKVAAATQKRMKTNSKIAGQKAMEPYADALKRATDTANEYAKRGDAMVAQSASTQMDAQMAQSQANQYVQVGDLAKSQGLMQQSRKLMDIATALNGQAGSFYDTAQSIMATSPAYTNEAGMAAYHAEVMLNPDAPPPAPPLVL